jgi:DNA-directed RNA polymerase specialized sigma24 family protein
MTDMTAEPPSDSFLPTRQSLLSRLRDCGDDAGWREFFENYWRLIYNVARKSGLADAEAQDVVQSTFIYLTRKMPKFRYDPARGSFKS